MSNFNEWEEHKEKASWLMRAYIILYAILVSFSGVNLFIATEILTYVCSAWLMAFSASWQLSTKWHNRLMYTADLIYAVKVAIFLWIIL